MFFLFFLEFQRVNNFPAEALRQFLATAERSSYSLEFALRFIRERVLVVEQYSSNQAYLTRSFCYNEILVYLQILSSKQPLYENNSRATGRQILKNRLLVIQRIGLSDDGYFSVKLFFFMHPKDA